MDKKIEKANELNDAELGRASGGRTKVRPSGLTIEEKKRVRELLSEEELAKLKAAKRAADREQFFTDHKYLIGK